MAISPDGNLLATTGKTGAVTVWDLTTGRETRTLAGRSSHEVLSVVYSPDGNSLLSADANETRKTWDVATGQETERRKGGTGQAH